MSSHIPDTTRIDSDESIDDLLTRELDSCQEYGHLYEACVGLGCTDDDCRIRVCAHCGDECED